MEKEFNTGDLTKAIHLLPLLASVGYFVYGGLDGVFGIIIFTTLLSLTVFLNLIPVLGFIIQVVLILMWLSPMILNFSGIGETWLTTTITGFILVISLIVNGLMTFLYILKKRLGWSF